eukprot:5674380-Amphidinium_carterae.1
MKAPQTEWNHWSDVGQAVCKFWLLLGAVWPKLEQWPRVGLPAPEHEPEVVGPVVEANLPAVPFTVS